MTLFESPKRKYVVSRWIVRTLHLQTKMVIMRSPILNPSGNLPINMHAGIIPITTDIFDPNDVLLLEASSNKDP